MLHTAPDLGGREGLCCSRCSKHVPAEAQSTARKPEEAAAPPSASRTVRGRGRAPPRVRPCQK